MENRNEILFISPYSPAAEDISSYNLDLFQTIKNKFCRSFSLKLCALVNDGSGYGYPEDTRYVFQINGFLDYITVAETINADENIKFVFLQHDFNAFKGEFGEDLLFLLRNLKKPIIATFHTVLPHPCAKRREVVQGIIKACQFVIVKNNAAAQLLRDQYNGAEHKITVISNGSSLIRSTAWQNHALTHARLFEKMAGNEYDLIYEMPDISLSYMKRLTSRIGIIQLSNVDTPDLESGYTLEDNANALISVTRHFELTNDLGDKLLIDRYLNFIRFCQLPDGKFSNFLDKNGKHRTREDLGPREDSEGMAIWALGNFFSKGYLFHSYYVNIAEFVLLKYLLNVCELKSPKAIAFAIKGLYHYNLVKKSVEVTNLINVLADKLIAYYRRCQTSDWLWFQDQVLCADSMFSEAMLYAYLSSGRESYKMTAKHSFDFLLSVFFNENKIKIISNRSWQKFRDQYNGYKLRAIDIAYTILALDLFYKVFNNETYGKKMDEAFSWFTGNNHLDYTVYDPLNGGCIDSLGENSINLNHNAGSTSCYLMARCVMQAFLISEKTNRKTGKENILNKQMNISGSHLLKNFNGGGSQIYGSL